MALRIRQNGSIWCAAMCEPNDGDLYINDDWHYRLTAESAVIVSHSMPKHAEQGGQWWWRWEAPTDCDFRMVNTMKMTDEQIKSYHDAMEKEFDEWMNDDATHWICDEDAAWQAWKEQEERKAHLKMAAEAEAKALDEANEKLKQCATLHDLIEATRVMNAAAVNAISGNTVIMPTSLSEPDTMDIADMAAEYLGDSMNLDSADICAIYLAVVWAVQDLDANTTKG